MESAMGLLGWFFENLVPIFALGLLLQLVFCYALQAIADKQGLPHSWLAWIPLVQVYLLVRGGNSSFQRFLVLMGTGIVTVIAGALLGPLGILLAMAWGLWALVYFGQLFWNTAENRNVSGWIGLLAFLPVLNFFAYLYIAFHDGPVMPSRLGLVLGVMFTVLPATPELRKAHEMSQLGVHFGPMANAAERGDGKAMTRTIYEMLQKMQDMEGFEVRGGDPSAMSKAMADLAAVVEGDGESAPTAEGTASPLAAEARAQTPLSPAFDCPDGTHERGARPPRASERWCERPDPARGAVRHGRYTSWHDSGGVRETGRYRDGQRDGLWTRWHAGGGMQAQAEFRDGLQHGYQIEWDSSGRKKRETRYAQGKPVSQ